MKKTVKKKWFILLGAILFTGGAADTLYTGSFWAVCVVYFGIGIVAFTAVSFAAKWQKVFADGMPFCQRIYNESLFLAKLFITSSWVLRTEGILAYEFFFADKKYSNFIYHMGKRLILDGYTPDDTKSALQRAASVGRQHICEKIHDLRQLGGSILTIGVFGGLSVGLMFGFRTIQGLNYSAESIICACVLTVLSLLFSIIIGWSLPIRLCSYNNHEKIKEQQVISGFLLLQDGVKPTEILQNQLLFLPPEEQEALLAQPLLEEYKDFRIRDDGSWFSTLYYWRKNRMETYEC